MRIVQVLIHVRLCLLVIGCISFLYDTVSFSITLLLLKIFLKQCETKKESMYCHFQYMVTNIACLFFFIYLFFFCLFMQPDVHCSFPNHPWYKKHNNLSARFAFTKAFGQVEIQGLPCQNQSMQCVGASQYGFQRPAHCSRDPRFSWQSPRSWRILWHLFSHDPPPLLWAMHPGPTGPVVNLALQLR